MSVSENAHSISNGHWERPESRFSRLLHLLGEITQRPLRLLLPSEAHGEGPWHAWATPNEWPRPARKQAPRHVELHETTVAPDSVRLPIAAE